MFFIRHSIANIVFFTESDTNIPAIYSGSLGPYLTNASQTEVVQSLHSVRVCDLTMPVLSPNERELVDKCASPDFLGTTEIEVVPLVKFEGLEAPLLPFLDYDQDPFNIPLLKSSCLRAHLAQALDHAEQVYLVLHPLTVEICDHFSHRIDIFFPDVMQAALRRVQYDSLVRRLFRIFLPDFDAFMIHSSAVIRHGKAAFFLARGGGGKTTVASQAPLAAVLGDDQVILRRQYGKFQAHSTPWGRVIGDPISAPLGSFFLLEQAEEFELTPIAPRQVMEHLWYDHAHLISMLPPKSRLPAFNLVDEAIHQVPLFRLRVPLNGVNWEAIDDAMAI